MVRVLWLSSNQKMQKKVGKLLAFQLANLNHLDMLKEQNMLFEIFQTKNN